MTHVHTSGPSLFKLDVALSGVPVLPQPGGEAGITANINLSPSLEYLERAWNSYERDEVAEQPSVMCAVPSVLDRTLAPEGKHTLWLSQWNPADLWRRASADEVEACADTMLATFEKYAPGTTEMVIGRRVNHANRARGHHRQPRRQSVPPRYDARSESELPAGVGPASLLDPGRGALPLG